VLASDFEEILMKRNRVVVVVGQSCQHWSCQLDWACRGMIRRHQQKPMSDGRWSFVEDVSGIIVDTDCAGCALVVVAALVVRSQKFKLPKGNLNMNQTINKGLRRFFSKLLYLWYP
jgi:hypothetical protein